MTKEPLFIATMYKGDGGGAWYDVFASTDFENIVVWIDETLLACDDELSDMDREEVEDFERNHYGLSNYNRWWTVTENGFSYQIRVQEEWK